MATLCKCFTVHFGVQGQTNLMAESNYVTKSKEDTIIGGWNIDLGTSFVKNRYAKLSKMG